MALNQVADDVHRELSAGRVISLADRQGLGLAAVSIEDVLDHVVRTYPVLLHGAGNLITAGSALHLSPGRGQFGRPAGQHEGFATDSAAIAVMKALFSNASPFNLGYPWVISPQSPLKLTIKNWNPAAERPRGYVHLIGPRSHFQRDRDPRMGDTWQWVTTRSDTKLRGALEVQPTDFVHPVVRA